MKNMIIVISFLFLLIMSACDHSSFTETTYRTDTEENSVIEKVDLLLPTKGNAMYYTYIAQENGYFEKEGLEVKLVPLEGGEQVIKQMAVGKEHIGIVAVPSLFSAWNEGRDIQVVYQINSTNIFDVIVPQYSTIMNIQDLKGKVIGVTDLGAAEVPMIQSILINAGLDPNKDVTIQPFGHDFSAILKAFELGEIAAFSGGVHDLVGLYAQGFQSQSLTPKEYKSLPSTCIIASGSMIKERPEIVEKILRSIAKAIHFSIENRKKSLEIMKKISPEEFKNEVIGQMSLERFINLSTPIQMEKGYGYIDCDLWEKLVEIYSRGEEPLLTKEIDFRQYLNHSFLQQANQF